MDDYQIVREFTETCYDRKPYYEMNYYFIYVGRKSLAATKKSLPGKNSTDGSVVKEDDGATT